MSTDHASETLLAGGVPDLEPDLEIANVDVLLDEGGASGGGSCHTRERVFGVSLDEARLAHSCADFGRGQRAEWLLKREILLACVAHYNDLCVYPIITAPVVKIRIDIGIGHLTAQGIGGWQSCLLGGWQK